MTDTILLTGATGFLGTQIAERIISETSCNLIVLVRAKDHASATQRLKREWWEHHTLYHEIDNRVGVAIGDVSQPKLGLDATAYNHIVENVTHIIHSAANLNLNGPLEGMRKVNVGGTKNIIELAEAIQSHHELKRLSHISTAYVSGGRNGSVPEDDLSDRHGFFNTYELTKFEAEKLVRDASPRLPVSIFRPGMIVGDSRTGQVRTFNTIYYPLRLYLKGELFFLPTSSKFKINIVPVDYVADAVTKLTFTDEAVGKTFHLTPPNESLPTVDELVSQVREWANDKMALSLPKMLFAPLPSPGPRARNQLTGSENSNGSLTGKLVELSPYFTSNRQYRRDNVDRLLGQYSFDYRTLIPKILEYATYNGIMHPIPRTVYEQILHRLSGHSIPVTINDIAEGKIVKRDSVQVKMEILSAAAALKLHGITKGDRVAIVGLNSSRYLTLDVAIGLIGAVSVPLYYTSPPSEIRDILELSCAKLLLVGAPSILQSLDEISPRIPVVSFCREVTQTPVGCVDWREFLAMGKINSELDDSPVDFEDLATIRYTSGTTGRPKGVCFTHGNLSWTAKASSSLFPWATRSRELSYLSFLPMNHVVEGIIGAYAPFYAPARLNIYFLEDFTELPKALPRAHPTVFFSVPRLYEKVWSSFQKSPIGNAYLTANGLRRSMLRPAARYALLMRAGLDRCKQLLVGSAPMSVGLQESYRELGVEIHNAYGLTEAPLVTMNIAGRNIIGTVGEALPETQVKIAEDGEILVKGPQVTQGYLDSSTPPPFIDGFLQTGDLGTIEGNYLRIEGRKKELIKTSYGKYVQPAKIEAKLKEIRDVEEAMIVGEGRPYCVALIWVKRGLDKVGEIVVIDKAIAVINKGLSHPEQVKKWAMLDNELSISKNELTANLKLKRAVIMSHFSPVVDDLYQGHLDAAEIHTEVSSG